MFIDFGFFLIHLFLFLLFYDYANILKHPLYRTIDLLKSNKLEFKPSNSLPNHSSNSSFDPSSSALHSASARMSGRTATRSAKSLQHRFATVHNKDFAMMDSIDHHYTVHRPSQKSDSLLKENLDPSSRSVDLEQRTHPTHLDGYKQIDNSTGIYLQQKAESVTTEVDLDYTPKSATKSKDNEFTVYNESEYTPPESPTKMFYDTTIGIPSLKIPKTEPVFLKECGPSTKRLSNLIPLSAAKRRKMTAIGDMLEIQRHNQIINPHIRPTSIPSRPLGQRTSDHYQSSNIKQFSISSLGNTQRPIVKSKLCPPGSLRFSNAFVKATDPSSFGFQNLSPTTESFIPTASNTRTSERFIKPNEDDPTVDAEPHAQNYGPSTASLIPRSNLQRSKSINENITSTNNNPANDMIQHLASKRLEQGFESNIPSISALNSEIQVSKGRGHSQHRSITTNIPLVPARSDKTGLGSGKTDALKRSVSVKTVSSSPSSLPHSSTQGSPRLRRRSSKILPSSTSSAPAHSPSVENHASASSAFPSRIPRAISTNGVYNLSGNGSHSSPSHSRSSSSNFSVSNSRPNV